MKDTKLTLTLVVFTSLLLSSCSSLGSAVSAAASAGTSAVPSSSSAALPAAPAATRSQAAGEAASLQDAYEAIYQAVNPSVVTIEISSRLSNTSFGRPGQQSQVVPTAEGSGFIWDSAGHIVTNNHVVDGADKIQVIFSDGSTYTARLVGADANSDLAVIQVSDAPSSLLKPIRVGDSTQVKVGQLVAAIGNPYGLSNTMTTGIVSAIGRAIPATASNGQDGLGNTPSFSIPDVIQTDAAINPGNSGGPLLNLDGKAIGINSAIISQSGGYMGIGLAIPINMASAVKEQLISGGKVVRGYVGITMNPEGLTPELAESFGYKGEGGVLVTEVLEESPASKAGLKQGDIITQLNGKSVSGNDYFRNTVSLMAPGTKIKLTVFREGKEKNITVEVASLSESKMSTKTSEIGTKLGLSVVPVDSDVARQLGAKGDQGVVVAEVTPRTPAQRAGIRPGMIILSVNQVYVNSVGEFNEALKETEETRSARLLIKTGRMAQYVLLKLEDK